MTRSTLLPDEPVASLDAYLNAGGGEGLAAATAMSRGDVIAAVAASGLRGRGGAGFPTGRKWSSIVQAAEEAGSSVALVCNGAEGEPGTFKDRALMRRTPYRILEGLLIARHAVDARRTILATKARYGVEAERLARARDEMAAAGWDGAADIEIVLGPDEYLYGEETALLEVLEGKLPFPRILPPYMVGLHGTMQQPNPTLANNIETLCHVVTVLTDGADAFRAQGTSESPGSMIFTVLGDVANAGVYELPLGTPLRTLLVDIAGARDFKAAYSGTSNSVITTDMLDLPLTFDDFSAAGTGLGSGGFVVYDSTRCIVQVAATLSRFLAVESCGQCPPCKLHGVAIHDLLERLCREGGDDSDLIDLANRCQSVTDQNRCYLPVGHALVVRSALDAFRSEFTDRLKGSCQHDDVPLPKITDIDDDTGAVILDETYDRKRLDWSYADTPIPASALAGTA